MGKIAAPSAGGKSRVKLIITLATSTSASLAGQTVIVKDLASSITVASFRYTGQPEILKIPAGMSFSVLASEKDGYVKPSSVPGIAMDDSAITIQYIPATRYGFRRAKANSATEARIEYLFDAIGKTPAAMNLSTNVMGYGDWADFINEVATPVMLKSDGAEDYKLDRGNQTLRADTGGGSDIGNTAYDGNAMVRFAVWKWVKRYEDANYEYVIFCNAYYDDTYHAYAHTDADGNITEAFYYSMYKGGNVNSKLRSLADRSIMVSQTRSTEVAFAMANGAGWDTAYKSAWDYIGDLLTLISKSDNGQNAFGTGRCASGNTSAISTGTLKTQPGFWGSSNQTSDVKVFWIEGFWGNIWEGMRGLINDNGTIKTKMVPPYNFDAVGYKNTGITPGGTSGGYISAASITDASGYVPKTANGSATTYYADGLWFNNGQVNYALVSGSWSSGLVCGPRCCDLNAVASFASTYGGARLSCVPKKPA
ncbi:MAG: hypothetical protein RR998_08310 [Oscillospiraceae bacterium]